MPESAMGDVGVLNGDASRPPAAPPPKEKKESESTSSKFVKVVDARFLEYDKPLTLAIVIGGLTLVVGIIVLVLQTSTSLFEVTTISASDTYPQYVGSMLMQWVWYDKTTGETTETEDSTETTVKTELCIDAIHMAVPSPNCQGTCTGTYQKAMRFWSAQAGQLGVAQLEVCWPGDQFMNGHMLDSSVQPAVWGATPNAQVTFPDGVTKAIPSIGLCSGVEAQYRVDRQVPDSANPGEMVSVSTTGGAAIRALSASELTEVTCSPNNNENGPIPWIVQYKQTITITSKIKPSLGDAIGIAFAYSTYIQVFFTALIVNVMLLGKCLKQIHGDGIDDSQELAEKVWDMMQGKGPSA